MTKSDPSRCYDRSGWLITISGPPATGKSTCTFEIIRRTSLATEIPFTTRKPRKEEIPGKEYMFIETSEFQAMIRSNEFACWDFILGNYYGYSKSLLDRVASGEKILIQVLARMALRLKQKVNNSILFFLKPPNLKILTTRLEERGDNQDEIKRRLILAEEDLLHSYLFDHIIICNEIDMSVSKIIAEIERREQSRNKNLY